MVGGGPTGQGSRSQRLHEWLFSPAPETGSTRLRVARAADGSWTVAEPGSSLALRHLVSREQALAVATSTLADARGGQIEVTEEDGAIHLIAVSKAKRLWWQVTKTPLPAFLLGLLWLGLLTIHALDAGWPPTWSYATLALVLSGFCAVLYLSSAVMLLRHRRARAGSPR